MANSGMLAGLGKLAWTARRAAIRSIARGYVALTHSASDLTQEVRRQVEREERRMAPASSAPVRRTTTASPAAPAASAARRLPAGSQAAAPGTGAATGGAGTVAPARAARTRKVQPLTRQAAPDEAAFPPTFMEAVNSGSGPVEDVPPAPARKPRAPSRRKAAPPEAAVATELESDIAAAHEEPPQQSQPGISQQEEEPAPTAEAHSEPEDVIPPAEGHE